MHKHLHSVSIASYYISQCNLYCSEVEAENQPPAPAIQVLPEEADLPPPLVIDPQAEFELGTTASSRHMSITVNRPIAITPTLPRSEDENSVADEALESVGDEALARGGDYRGSYHLSRRTNLEE